MLRLERVKVSIQSSHILREVSLEVGARELVCLVGRNGAGKTTTLRTVVGSRCARVGRAGGRAGQHRGAGWGRGPAAGQLRPGFRDRPCSLPPGAPQALPAWADIKTAKITEIGEERADLFIALYEPVPAVPPVPFLADFWQFEDGCLDPSSPTDKDGIRVRWDGNTETWSADWFVVTSCDPRTVELGAPVPFHFTSDGVRVRISLSDLLTVAGPTLRWYAGVRRLPFIHGTFTRTVAVDVAPDVIEFNPDPPPILITPEDPAPWEPR